MKLFLTRGLPTLLLALLVVPYLDFVPIWDGRFYLYSIYSALEQPFRLLHYCVANHPTFGYLGWLALPQAGLQWLLGPGQFWTPLVHLQNLALASGALLAFSRIVDRIWPEPGHAVLRWALPSALALSPVVSANLLFFSPDFAVFCGVLILVDSLNRSLEGASPWALAKPLGWAVFLCFSRETGMALAVTIPLLWAALGEPKPGRWRVAGFVTAAALAASGAYFAYRATQHLDCWIWNCSEKIPWQTLVWPNVWTPTFRAFFATTYILNFMWLWLVPLTSGLVAALVRVGRGGPRRIPRGDRTFWIALLLTETYLLSRVFPHSNARYSLTIVPAFLICATLGLETVLSTRVKPSRGWAAFWGLIFAVSFWGQFRSQDPVSLSLWGRLPFGDHGLYDMTRLRAECCERGRDQLAYNHEFLMFERLRVKAFRALAITPQTVVTFNPGIYWVYGPVAYGSQKSVARVIQGYMPRYVPAPDLLSDAPTLRGVADFVWIHYPFTDDTGLSAQLATRFWRSEIGEVEENGYRLVLTQWKRR